MKKKPNDRIKCTHRCGVRLIVVIRCLELKFEVVFGKQLKIKTKNWIIRGDRFMNTL